VLQQEHASILLEIQSDLVQLQAQLDELGDGVFDALWQSLRQVAKLRIDEQPSEQLVRQTKSTIEDLWARQVAKDLRPRSLDKVPGVLEALSKHPLVKVVVEQLVSGTG
jgi:hypothetical protein